MMLPPRLSTMDCPSGTTGVTGLYSQFMNPTTVTNAKATRIAMERTVLTQLTSLRPIRLMIMNTAMIANLTVKQIVGSVSPGINVDA